MKTQYSGKVAVVSSLYKIQNMQSASISLLLYILMVIVLAEILQNEFQVGTFQYRSIWKGSQKFMLGTL